MNPGAGPPGGEILVYQALDGEARVDVHLDRDTAWLTQEQMAEILGRERTVVNKHSSNVFKEGELKPEAVRACVAHAAAKGRTYQVGHFTLDEIISVGYRVEFLCGTPFLSLAMRTSRDHLLRGYTLNERRPGERGILAALPTGRPAAMGGAA